MKNILKYLFFLVPVLLLSGCTKYGKLDEGDCKGVIAFTDIPKTFFMMDEEWQEQTEIGVLLQNITTETEYRITLNKTNQYKQELSLHPGIYRVTYVFVRQPGNTGLDAVASAETMEFTRNQEARLDIAVKDPDAFTKYWMDMQPSPEILLADKYSGMIQINRKNISIKDIMPELRFSNEKNLNAYQKEDFTDSEAGITVTVQNKTNAPLFFDECEVIGITVSKNTVVFPGGLTLANTPVSVFHRKDGLYGEPTSMKGSALYGLGGDYSYAVYTDPISGNRITIKINDTGKSIVSIQFEFAVFE